jgi:hypothetical protein
MNSSKSVNYRNRAIRLTKRHCIYRRILIANALNVQWSLIRTGQKDEENCLADTETSLHGLYFTSGPLCSVHEHILGNPAQLQ